MIGPGTCIEQNRLGETTPSVAPHQCHGIGKCTGHHNIWIAVVVRIADGHGIDPIICGINGKIRPYAKCTLAPVENNCDGVCRIPV